MSTSGILLVDKPGGMTSHDVVGACRRLLGRKDIGHAGTLDPMATGLLVVLVGKATKLSDYILNGDKAYETTVRLGLETDTDDITGEVTQEWSDFQVTPEQVRQAVSELSGTLELSVPIYSAIKVKGKKLYEKARKGEDFEPPKRQMTFENVEILGFEDQRVSVRFQCSKGSYVRAWGKALGQKLQCGGTLESLRRVRSVPYDVNSAVSLQQVEEQDLQELPGWIPLRQTLPTWPLVKVEGHDEKLLMNGQISRKLERFLELEYASVPASEGVKVVSKRSGELISLLSQVAPLKFKIKRVFPQ